MLNIKTFIFGRKNETAPTPEVVSPALRLRAMIESDRADTGTANQLRLQRKMNKRRKPVRGIPPAVEARSTKPATSDVAALVPQKAATPAQAPASTVDVAPSIPVDKTMAAPTSRQERTVELADSLALMELETGRVLAGLEAGALNRFRKYARKKKLSVARVRNKECFASEATQQAWEVWQDAELQCRTLAIEGLREQLLQTQEKIDQISERPIAVRGRTPDFADMTVIIKRLAVLLHKSDPSSSLPANAMQYLKRRGLLDGSANI